MNREDALKKIKKCLALARSTNPHEAAAALRQAQKLMSEFEVTDHDVSMIDVNEARARACSTAPNVWEVRLSMLIAEAFGCARFAQISSHYTSSGNYVRTREYVFIGVGAAPSVAAYAYEVMSRQCAKARLAHIGKQPRNCKPITKTVRGDEFAKGWVYGVRKLIERFATGDRDDALLLTYMGTKHPDVESRPARDTTKDRKTNLGHAMAGLSAAGSAQLNAGLGGVGPQVLLA
jgi:hypothetical protein